MEKFTFILLFCIVVFVDCFKYKVVDLTHNHGNDSIYWPTHTGYQLTYSQRGEWKIGSDEALWVAAYTIKTTEHLGTHLDAPRHFNQYAWTMHQIPIDHLVGPGVIINIKEKAAKNPDYLATTADVKEWEEKYGRIPDGAVVLLKSGWSEKHPDKKLVFGTDDPTDISSFHFPAWHIDAVRWITQNRNIHIIGTDCPSFDEAQSDRFPVHVLVSQENISGLENVAYLDKIPESGTIISAASMKIEDGSGSPARVFAFIPLENSGRMMQPFLLFLMFSSIISRILIM